MIGTGVRGAGSEDLSTSGSTVRKLTQTGETCHTVHTSALVQAGTGCTFVDVHLAKVTCWRGREDIKTCYRTEFDEAETWPDTDERICTFLIHH